MLLVALTAATTTNAAAAFDPSTFTVAGLKLGMRSEQALAVIKTRGTVASIRREPCVSDWLAAQLHRGDKVGQNCITSIAWTQASTTLTADFVEGFPARLGSTLLFKVNNPHAPPLDAATSRLLDRPNYRLKTASAVVEKWCTGKPCSPILAASPEARDEPFLLITIYRGHTERTLDAGHSATEAAQAETNYLRSRGVTNF